MAPNQTPGGSRLKALSGKACPHCGGAKITWAALSYFKLLFPFVVIIAISLPAFSGQSVFTLAFLFLPSLLLLPTLRRCRDCNLNFKAPMARLFAKSERH